MLVLDMATLYVAIDLEIWKLCICIYICIYVCVCIERTFEVVMFYISTSISTSGLSILSKLLMNLLLVSLHYNFTVI